MQDTEDCFALLAMTRIGRCGHLAEAYLSLASVCFLRSNGMDSSSPIGIDVPN